jgi:ABC-2 type transport system permease protein
MRALEAIRLVALREINERVRTRVFMITTGVMVLMIVAAAAFVPGLLADDEPDVFRAGVVGALAPEISDALAESVRESGLAIQLSLPRDVAAGEALVRDDKLDALLVDGTEVVVREGIAGWQRSILSAAAVEMRLIADLADSGGSAEVAATVLATDRSLSLRQLVPPDENSPSSSADRVLGMVSVILMYMAIVIYGQVVMTGVIQEKSSRVVELLLATIRPQHLLAGKVFGIGLMGLAQLLVVGLAGLATALVTGLTDVPEFSARAGLAVFAWFILVYVFYSSIFAAAGSLVSRMEDSQSAVGPVMVIAVVSYLISFVAVQQDGPDTLIQVANIAAILPPVAPFAMTAKMMIGTAETWQIVLSIALMLVSTYGMIRLAARLYQGSVMQSGLRVDWRDAWRRGRTERAP